MLKFTQNIQIMGKATKSVIRFRCSLSRVVDAQRWMGTYDTGIFDEAPFVAAFIHLRRFRNNAEDYGFVSQVRQNLIQTCRQLNEAGRNALGVIIGEHFFFLTLRTPETSVRRIALFVFRFWNRVNTSSWEETKAQKKIVLNVHQQYDSIPFFKLSKNGIAKF